MERKTIGAFIAALRKAQGMTQRQLAEKLNVSDKTISRWERDDGAPDLSAIPVLAEIFNVSCDELLRGERRPEEERPVSGDTETSARGEKQRRRLITVSLVKFQNRSYIAMAVALAGLVAAMISNFGFLKANLGFFLALVFYLGAALCQLIFRNSALLAVSDVEEDESLAGFRLSVLKITEYSLGLNFLLFMLSLPLALPYLKSNMGLTAESWLEYGALAGAVALPVIFLACYLVNGVYIGRGCLPESVSRAFTHNHRLKARCALILAAAALVTAVIHVASTQVWGPWSIAEGTEFQDLESFKAYMEEYVPDPWYTDRAIPEPVGPTTYYDENGREISEEEAFRRTITDPEGNVLCEYVQRNKAVTSVQSRFQGGKLTHLETFTQDDITQARATARARHMVFAFVYALELAATLLVYYKKRLRLAR